MNKKTGNQLKIVYTSLHGTGITIVPRALKEFGFSHIILVDSQVTPDGSFPTVKTPNPEEKEALQMGIEKLKETDSDLLIATDPDTDRIGVAVKHEGEVHLLNGNQFACLCTYYILDALSKQNKLPEKAAFVKTIGTTELLKAICHHFGRPCFDVLTGFKYIAEKIREWDLNPNGFQFIFGGEESFGYLLGTQTRDKDAISAAVLIAEAALSAKNHSKTLIDCLHEIYKKCGFYFEKLMTFEFPETKDGREAMAATMEAMRRAPPKTLAGIAVEWIEDFQKSIKTHLTTGKTEPIQLKTSDVLLFWLEDGSKLMIRPSGTEPKIKIYCGIKEPSFTSLAVAKAACEKKANSLIDALKTSKER